MLVLDGCAEDFVLPVGTLSEQARSSIVRIGLTDFTHDKVILGLVYLKAAVGHIGGTI